ncbi:MAG: FHA domain-containing protein [Bifidobacterium animalis]|nr:FHA domain-containing protein [Bifidobacterium animalis]MDY5040527.1 FHA domain-containing protein [Bifidobacterium animalis]
MSSEQGATTRWVILVDGTQLASVEPGTTVEIGRKPLRPLPDDGKRRVEILDDSRSVSKRHAQLMVALDGRAFLRDLNSTNGTFVVRAGDELVRLHGGVDYPLQSDSVHVQFGDVPVDFAKFIEDDDSTKDDAPVVNLFDYAVEGSSNEPEAADMSVDDILNLRAGEPTDIFNASMVRARAKRMHDAEQQSFVPFTQPINPLPMQDLDDSDAGDAAPRDLFADAKDVAEGKISEPAAAQEHPYIPKMSDKPKHAGAPADRLISVSELASAHPRSMPQPQENMPEPAAEVDHAASEPIVVEQTSVTEETTQEPAEPVAAEPAPTAPSIDEQGESVQPSVNAPAVEETDGNAEESAAASEQSPVSDEESRQNEEPSESEGVAPAEAAPETEVNGDIASLAAQDVPQDEQELHGDNAPETATVTVDAADVDYSRFQRHDEPQTDAPANGEFEPAFEPGSVFEKVANGDFAKPEPLVSVAGFTSDDARRSDDFSEQFEMARHPELLPFLAMNPSLYDDLYTWLAAQGNADIDEALSKNAGYEDYRKAVGK